MDYYDIITKRLEKSHYYSVFFDFILYLVILIYRQMQTDNNYYLNT